ncbi:TD and POZ domain-containing protein 3 [Nephila pilipes]|uniref:TD and POZ domain-containing protein 3 n=1 Tax=Nephila pilipes TaxID=299642 RepID=A0A8X6UC54_NEPPI|nr:TD and POZ domain-containing protein 3 [Nephila pilipes]
MGQNTSIQETKKTHGCYDVHKFQYQWSIPNFKTLVSSGKVGNPTCTQNLNLDVQSKTNSFTLILYPNGFNDRVKDYISLWIKRTSTDEMLIQFTCEIKNLENKTIRKKSIKERLSIESHLGWTTFCRRSILIDNADKILSNENLILHCTLEIFEDRAIMNAETEDDEKQTKNTLSEMVQSMNKLLSDGYFYDIIIKVEGKRFEAHKAILSSRSRVFKTMFESPLEKNSKEFEISDISEETAKEMLHYIYFGEVGYLDVKNAMEIYYAADKYELHSLKIICSRIMVGNINIDNVIDYLLFSYRHSDYDLEDVCITFIAKNAPDIQKKAQWVDLMIKHPILANKVFKHLSKK